jgi:hypothetical protein
MSQFHSPRARSPRAKFVPGLEALDDRIVPAAITTNLNTHTGALTITGTDKRDVITISDTGTNGNSAVTVRDGRHHLLFHSGTGRMRVKDITVNTRDGDDTAAYRLTGNAVTLHRTLNAQFGKGNNNFRALLQGGLSGASFVMFTATGGNVHNDFRAEVDGGIHDSSFLAFFFTGGDGPDQLNVDAAHNVNIDASAQMTLQLDGRGQGDGLDVVYAGRLQGAFFLDVFGNGGNDTASARLDLTDASTGRLLGPVSPNSGSPAASVRGGAGADTLAFLVRGQPGQLTSNSFAEVDCGPDADPTPNVGDPAQPSAVPVAVFNQ